MGFKDLTSSQQLLAKVRSIRALARAESDYLDRGYDPVETVKLVYERAINYYDNVFPEDEVSFRQMLLDRYERQLFRARRRAAQERREARTSGKYKL